MPYSYRRKDEPYISPYLQHGALGSAIKGGYQRLNQSWGNGAGKWVNAAVKYVDKRLINGNWRYLYPEDLQRAKQAVANAYNNAKTSAKNAYNSAKTTTANAYNSAKKSVSNFRNYSTNVDSQRKENNSRREQLERERNDLSAERARREEQVQFYQEKKNDNRADVADTRAEYREQLMKQSEMKEKQKRLDELDAQWQNRKNMPYEDVKSVQDEMRQLRSDIDRLGKETANIDEARAAERAKAESRKYYTDAIKSAESESERLGKEVTDRESQLHDLERNDVAASAAQDTGKYKASQILDRILDTADNATSVGARFLKDMYDIGSDWAEDKYNEAKDFGKEKYNQTVDLAKEKYNATTDWGKEKYNQAVDTAKNTYNELSDRAKEQYEQASNFVNDKYNQAADWIRDQQEKFRESDAIAGTSAKLEQIYNSSNNQAIQNAANFINQLIGWEDLSQNQPEPESKPEQVERATPDDGGVAAYKKASENYELAKRHVQEAASLYGRDSEEYKYEYELMREAEKELDRKFASLRAPS